MNDFFEDVTVHVADRAEEILAETLNDGLANELAQQIADTIRTDFLCGKELRYLLIDGETGRPASRLFEQFREALDEMTTRNLNRCCVATVILEQ